jgi:hypothetical protein
MLLFGGWDRKTYFNDLYSFNFGNFALVFFAFLLFFRFVLAAHVVSVCSFLSTKKRKYGARLKQTLTRTALANTQWSFRTTTFCTSLEASLDSPRKPPTLSMQNT